MKLYILKHWVAFLSLIVASASLILGQYQYYQLTKPHSLHSEIYDRLIRLDGAIQRYEEYIQSYAPENERAIANFRLAQELRDQAETAWVSGDYNKADILIQKAYDIPINVPVLPPPPTNWWIVGVLIVATLIIIGALLFILRRRKPSGYR